jgi:endogenous inhibitor of DNA gyrase (YacG/DUF329 family)
VSVYTESRTCPAFEPWHTFGRCGAPVVGRSDKRFCSRRCQNRDQKERWRAENRMADIRIRMGERHRRRLAAIERDRETMQRLTEEFEQKHPGEAEFVQEVRHKLARDVEEEFEGIEERVRSKLRWRAA